MAAVAKTNAKSKSAELSIQIARAMTDQFQAQLEAWRAKLSVDQAQIETSQAELQTRHADMQPANQGRAGWLVQDRALVGVAEHAELQPNGWRSAAARWPSIESWPFPPAQRCVSPLLNDWEYSSVAVFM
ncbi:hypothetical protein CCO03_01150 [Comamonas serinivorans]|uniref:Uncharacterized protein n=1 Tax=Comamonas serinivorans TaxID=1082851 RepID=A0A1Y0EIM6_9BURK|nr:hypothetical protein [Comamonas serinivorans]ARU03473.1 hypothetical protein CCO03_01150 [Comamonas serinivorans]